MELYIDDNEKKKSKIPMIIGICIVILLLITGFMIYGIVYLSNNIVTVEIDGVKNNNVEQILYMQESENGSKLYIPIRKIAQFLNYKDYRGDYKNKSEDPTKCYVQNEFEIAMFTLDSDMLTKTRGDSDYEYIQIDEKVFEINGELYTTIDGIQKAFNVVISTDAEYKNIKIYTMDYLIQYYALQFGVEEYSENFTDKKAIFENMLVLKKDEQYGVLSIETGEFVLENKYESISYLPFTQDFLVKSNGKYGVIGKDTEVKIRTVYDEIKIMDNQNGLYLVKQNNLYGVVNTDGKLIIEPDYKKIGIDMNHYSQSGIENQYVLLDEIIPIQNSDDMWGLFKINGEQIRDFEFTDIGCSETSANNLYPVVSIPSHKVIVVEKGEYYNLVTVDGKDILTGYVLNSVYMRTNTETGENTYYMTHDNNQKVTNAEEWLTGIGK